MKDKNAQYQDRINQFLVAKGLTVNQLSKKLNIPQTTLNNQIIGNRRISIETIDSILNSFDDVSSDWLLLGKGDMFKSSQNIAIRENSGIPLYKTEAAAGFGTMDFSILDRDVEARYQIRELADASFMLYIKGDSMLPSYRSGDIIAVKTIVNFHNIQWGQPHLVSTANDGILVKRIYNNENSITLISDNPIYPPIYIDKSEILGIGKVIGVIKLENIN